MSIGKKASKRSNSMKKVEHMPDASKAQDKPVAKEAAKKAAKEAAKENKPVEMGVRLTAVDNSDQPVVANYTALNVSPGMAFIDFGFLEPGMLAALPRVARSGGKMPERLDGKLAVRVAMGYDALANLHQQLGRVLRGLSEARAAGANKDA